MSHQEPADGDAPYSPTKVRRHGPPDRVFKWIAVVAAVCLIGFIVFVAVRGPSSTKAQPGTAALEVPPPAVLKTGSVAPLFTLPALGGGTPISLSAFRGTPVILNFFASWCPHCRAELGSIADVARHEGHRVVVIGVDANDTSSASAQKLLAEAHATYPVGWTPRPRWPRNTC